MSEDSSLALQGCFDCTDWSVFTDSCDNIDELTDVVCSYISFCEDNVIPTKTVKVFPNNKPWASSALKGLIHNRKNAFNEGDLPKVKDLNREIKSEIKKAKLRYKDKIEAELSSNNLKEAWNGMKVMTGSNDKGIKHISMPGFNSDVQLADELNSFYLRFENQDFADKVTELKLKSRAPCTALSIDIKSVEKHLRHTKSKSPGPDNIGGKVLSTCAEQLCSIFHFIFNLSLQQQRVPKLWKHSTVVPVAKIKTPKAPNDFRPVALTSLIMKSLEKVVKDNILKQVETSLDPLQFAYRSGRGVDDATTTLLHFLYRHLEGVKTHARLLFIDFSSAFNTIQPHILAQKLIDDFKLDLNLVGWILDFLTDRSQCVRVNETLSSRMSSSTGSPQGCCLSSLLYILYTNDCRSNHLNRHIIKFADDSVIVSLLEEDEVQHGPVVDDFISWCDKSFLQLNVSKTKDMVISFRRTPPSPAPTLIKGTEIEVVESYKYLGVVVFLRKMRSFNVSSEMMTEVLLNLFSCFV